MLTESFVACPAVMFHTLFFREHG